MQSSRLKNRVKSRFLFRVVIPGIFLILVFMYAHLSYSWMPVIIHLTHPSIACEDMTVNDMCNGLTVKGELDNVIDCFGVYETETHVDERLAQEYNIPEKSEESYIWISAIDENTLMLIHASPDDYSKLNRNAIMYWKSLDTDTDSEEDAEESEYSDSNKSYKVKVDATLKKNDPEVLALYQDWLRAAGLSAADVKLAPYTLDMTRSYASCVKSFGIGSLILLIVIGILWLTTDTYIRYSKKKTARETAIANAMSQGFGSYTPYGGSQSSNSYQSFTSQRTSYPPQKSTVGYGRTNTSSAKSNVSCGNMAGSFKSSYSSKNSDQPKITTSEGGYTGYWSGSSNYASSDSTDQPKITTSEGGYTGYRSGSSNYASSDSTDQPKITTSEGGYTGYRSGSSNYASSDSTDQPKITTSEGGYTGYRSESSNYTGLESAYEPKITTNRSSYTGGQSGSSDYTGLESAYEPRITTNRGSHTVPQSGSSNYTGLESAYQPKITTNRGSHTVPQTGSSNYTGLESAYQPKITTNRGSHTVPQSGSSNYTGLESAYQPRITTNRGSHTVPQSGSSNYTGLESAYQPRITTNRGSHTVPQTGSSNYTGLESAYQPRITTSEGGYNAYRTSNSFYNNPQNDIIPSGNSNI